MTQGILDEKKSGKIIELPELPPLPTIAGQVLNEISNENIDIRRLSEIIEKDPGLLARIIGIANSAYFGCPENIYCVSDAIIKVLGLNMVKNLALGIVLNNPFRNSNCPGFEVEQYWYSAMYTATLARELAGRLPVRDKQKEECIYLAGLMHNLGQIVLVYCFPSEMSKVFLEFKSGKKSDLLSIENKRVGLDQIQAGGIIVNKWHLPEDVATVINNYSNPAYDGNYSELSGVVGLANSVAYLDCDEIAESKVCNEYLSALGITLDTVIDACKKVEMKKQEIIGMACVLALD